MGEPGYGPGAPCGQPRIGRSTVVDATEIAWTAGLFEGEGTIRINRGLASLALGMTDDDVVESFGDIVACGAIHVVQRTPSIQAHWKQQWVWRAGEQGDVERLLRSWLPWFGVRRADRAAEALLAIAEFHADLVAVCPQCGETYRAERRNRRKYCSDICANRFRGMQRWKAEQKPLLTRDCLVCGTSFTTRRESKIYCSRSCNNKAGNRR